MNQEDTRRPRGSLPLYAAAFTLMMSAAVVLVLAAGDFLRSLVPLWISTGLSAAAIVAALVCVLLPRRG